MAGLVAQALGRQDEQQEEQQPPVDNPQEARPAATGGNGWNDDKVLRTATELAFETMYADGGMQGLEERLSGAQDIAKDMADIVANVMLATLAKAQGNGRTIPDDTLQKLAKTLLIEVVRLAGIMGLVPDIDAGTEDAAKAVAMAKQMLPAVMQSFQQKQQQPRQPPQGAAGMPQQAGGMQ